MLPKLFDALVVHRDSDGGGGGSAAPAAPAPAASAAPPAPAAPATPPAPAAGPAAPAADGDRVKQLETELANARREAAGYRTAAKGQLGEFVKQLNELVGGKPDQPSDPSTILKQLQERDSEREKELRQLKVDNALGDVFTKHGVNPRLTKALLASEGALAAVDPREAGFSKSLSDAVEKLLKENPQIKATGNEAPRAPRSGPDLPPGGSGAPPQLGKADLANMTSKQISEAYEKGQLKGILGGQ